MYAAYAEQVQALAEGGVDLLLIETIFDTLNAKAAIAAARDVAPQLPLWISVTIVDLSGRTLSGQTVEAFWRVGGARRAADRRGELLAGRGGDTPAHRRAVPAGRHVHRLPSERRACRTRSAATTRPRSETARLLGGFAEPGIVNVVGGCCGTTPEHIARIAAAVAGLPPRPVPAPARPAPGSAAWSRSRSARTPGSS